MAWVPLRIHDEKAAASREIDWFLKDYKQDENCDFSRISWNIIFNVAIIL